MTSAEKCIRLRDTRQAYEHRTGNTVAVSFSFAGNPDGTSTTIDKFTIRLAKEELSFEELRELVKILTNEVAFREAIRADRSAWEEWEPQC